MWINPCNGIHMMFMNFAIDAVFLDRKERVKKVYRKLPAWWGVVWFVWGAESVLELPARFDRRHRPASPATRSCCKDGA